MVAVDPATAADVMSSTGEHVPASMLETVLTVGGFVLVILLVVGLQLWSFGKRRRGEEATSYDGRGAEVLLGNWFT